MEAACTRCRDQGAASVWLATNSENTPARAFYRARGFGEVGQTQFRIADQTYENTVYRYVFGPDGG
ncbi:GNAT family N-acetyltransferase [Pseudodonghicola flavimaris]|uniref:GNAT family N-acetyltransferase n=1 Tax=Pseudodonghicola flavimaris TaxID=3050036 RepID=UPI002AA29D64|nr:GNAT family N-acetyltransferase [Pseudodonghicola flavimaris]